MDGGIGNPRKGSTRYGDVNCRAAVEVRGFPPIRKERAWMGRGAFPAGQKLTNPGLWTGCQGTDSVQFGLDVEQDLVGFHMHLLGVGDVAVLGELVCDLSVGQSLLVAMLPG